MTIEVEAWRRQLEAVYALPEQEADAIRAAAQQEARTRFSEEERLRETLARAQRAVLVWGERRAGRGPADGGAWQWAKAGIALLLAAKASLLPVIF